MAADGSEAVVEAMAQAVEEAVATVGKGVATGCLHHQSRMLVSC